MTRCQHGRHEWCQQCFDQAMGAAEPAPPVSALRCGTLGKKLKQALLQHPPVVVSQPLPTPAPGVTKLTIQMQPGVRRRRQG